MVKIDNKITECNKRTEYNKKYQSKNKEQTRYLVARSTSRSFIKNKATLTDLQELKRLIKEREMEIIRMEDLVLNVDDPEPF